MKRRNKSSREDGWIRTTNKLPKERDWYLGIFQEPDTGYIFEIPEICDYVGKVTSATTDEGWIIMNCTDTDNPYEYYRKLHCVAWHELPEPYEP